MRNVLLELPLKPPMAFESLLAAFTILDFIDAPIEFIQIDAFVEILF